ncbi:MAG: DUF2911 domain-containing protein, partial [Saprospiraceae bacterium]|nr:DUF2911 domain-containing protein [Saprospiraceae bacterium]
MKKPFFLLLMGLLGLATTAFSQTDKAQRPSPSAQAKAMVNGKTITIDYSQPAVKGRKIWGELVPYGQVWRTGANETTAFEVSDAVMVEGKKLAKGRYALFTIPGEKEWTIVFNKTIAWGEYSYKEAEDVLRVKVPSKASAALNERFTINISDQGVVSLLWENLQ